MSLLKTIVTLFIICYAQTSKTEFVRPDIVNQFMSDEYDGYQIINGKILMLNSIICHSSVGKIPGKIVNRREPYFSFNGREYVCHNFQYLTGKRIPNTGEVPAECLNKGYPTDDGRMLYPIIAYNRHGEIPGKAYDPKQSYYGYDKGQYRRPYFDWFC